MIEQLKEKYIDTKQAVADADALTAPITAELTAKIEQITNEHKALHAETYGLLESAQSAFNEADTALRDAAKEHYEVSGEKSFDSNIGVRVTKKLEYPIDKAVEWAETNAPVMIQKTVDKKAFESLPTVADLEFVTVKESVSAVIKGI